jgi:hypothetical protein
MHFQFIYIMFLIFLSFQSSLRMFETSLFDYLNKAKVDYYITVGVKLVKVFYGEDILDKFYVNEPDGTTLDSKRTNSLFLVFISALVIPIIVLLLEILISYFRAQSMES